MSSSNFIYSIVAVFFLLSVAVAIWRQKRRRLPPPPLQTQESMPSQPQEANLRKALENSRDQIWGRIRNLFGQTQKLSPQEFEQLEEILYTSDLGPKTVQRLLSTLEEKLAPGQLANAESVRSALREEMLHIFALNVGADLSPSAPLEVWLIVGINGAGKTTTIGKLAAQHAQKGKKVLVAAGDTFRAAAEAQLRVWTERAQVEIFSPPDIKDPSAVAYAAVERAQSQGFDLVFVDTAGRLHTSLPLMEELKKIKRSLSKKLPESPQQVLLVLDANAGQNALIQAREFHQAVGVTGVILTKLDGSSKGGVALGVAHELHLPIYWVGIGEKLSDLKPFSATEFVDSIL